MGHRFWVPLQYLNGDGPASTNESFSEAMLSTTRNRIQDTVMDACHTIGLRYHSTGLWASCPPSVFLPKEKVQVRFLATNQHHNTASSATG